MASPEFIVSAIKHRPTTFAEVLAQDHITRTLQHSLERGQVANAYLFSGPRGTGKTSTARILTKALNCENLINGEPCNQCDSCKMTTKGIHPDVLEIDAASNTGVENIRELRENARFSPSIGKFKIYIIDECHMLSTQANNALLKTLEEPPSHCRFIFATTEIQKILPTILSRCQRFPFRRIPAQIIVDHLKQILIQQDELEFANPSQLDQILFLLARSSEGCLRDALFALDQLLAFCSGKLDLAEVEEIMGAIEFDRLDQYIRAIILHELPVILEIIEKLTNQGKEISLFLAECLQYLRNLAVIKIAPKNTDLLDLPDEYRKQLTDTASLTSLEQILYITDQLWDTEQRIRNSSMGRLIIELASIKAAKAGQAVKIEDLLEKVSSGSFSGGAVIEISAPPAISTVAPEPAVVNTPVSAPVSAPITTPNPTPAPAPEPVITPDPEPKQAQSAPIVEEPVDDSAPPLESYEESPPTTDETEEFESPKVTTKTTPQPSKNQVGEAGSLSTMWNQFLHELDDPMLAGALEGSVALEFSNEILRIAIPSDHAYSLRTLERPNNRTKLTEILSKSFGTALSLRYEQSNELNQINEKHAQPTTVQPVVSRQELMEKVQQDKIFGKLMEEMPGRVINIKPIEKKTAN